MDSLLSAPLTLPLDHLGLYVHIPFCLRKCRYCDFASRPLADDPALPERYLTALAHEALQRRAEIAGPLHSIFIGGGTPSLLSGSQLRRLWTEVIDLFPRIPTAEITLEANPGTLNADVLAALADLPFTRVSLGVQSAHADELALLGRPHTFQQVSEAVESLRDIGIPQLNLDLIYALPMQSAARWAETLRQVLALAPDHLSLYALILEDGTPLAAQVAEGILPAASEVEEALMAEASQCLLSEAGFRLYEVSNAARAGAVSRHNLGYWLGRDYLGLGAAATSTLRGLRWRNREDAAGYTARLLDGQPAVAYAERLAAPARLLERVMLGLRLREGFDLLEAETACGCRLEEIAATALAACRRDGLLEYAGGVLRFTPTGHSLANTVVARLMANT